MTLAFDCDLLSASSVAAIGKTRRAFQENWKELANVVTVIIQNKLSRIVILQIVYS